MTDHLNGLEIESAEYLPFGLTRIQTGTEVTYYRFTDQELDAETGLYNYNARLYDPAIGIFISPDSIVQNPYDPQSLNRFSYCRNNPLIYVDPSGHSFFSDLFNALDPVTYVSRKSTEYLIDQTTSGDLKNMLQGMDNGFWNSLSPQIAAENGGIRGVAGWITGGTLSYSYEGGWGAHAGGGYACFFGSTAWQERGPNSGWTQTVGIGFQKSHFIAGVALSYNFSHDQHIQVGLYCGVQGKGYSLGINYNLNNGYASGWSSVSMGEYLPEINTAGKDKGYRPMSIINWAIGIQNVTGIEGSGNLFGEKHWLTIALDERN
jgi:RHS repeat-associated protein